MCMIFQLILYGILNISWMFPFIKFTYSTAQKSDPYVSYTNVVVDNSGLESEFVCLSCEQWNSLPLPICRQVLLKYYLIWSQLTHSHLLLSAWICTLSQHSFPSMHSCIKYKMTYYISFMILWRNTRSFFMLVWVIRPPLA